MEKYKFCTKNSDEAISVTEASCGIEATEYFADLKKLSVGEFLDIYDVKIVEITRSFSDK